MMVVLTLFLKTLKSNIFGTNALVEATTTYWKSCPCGEE